MDNAVKRNRQSIQEDQARRAVEMGQLNKERQDKLQEEQQAAIEVNGLCEMNLIYSQE